MHASKSFIVVTASALLISAAGIHASDTPEEAALREALRKSETATPGQPAAPLAAKLATTPAPAPVAQPAPQHPAPVVVRPAAAPAPSAPPSAGYEAVPPANDSYDALIQALRTQPGQVVTPPPAAAAATPASKPAPVMASKSTAPAPAPAPIVAPALPISASQEQRLAELLRQYKADQITPEQYHMQRAAILAGQ
jgi:hypothetical protein